MKIAVLYVEPEIKADAREYFIGGVVARAYLVKYGPAVSTEVVNRKAFGR